jgi:hypothetical protein
MSRSSKPAGRWEWGGGESIGREPLVLAYFLIPFSSQATRRANSLRVHMSNMEHRQNGPSLASARHGRLVVVPGSACVSLSHLVATTLALRYAPETLSPPLETYLPCPF